MPLPPEFRAVLDGWQPVPEEVTGPLTPWPAAALAALLGAEPPAGGDPLPPLWSEVYLRSALPVAALVTEVHEHSVDGRPRLREERDIVYRRAEDVRAPAPRGAAADEPAGTTYEIQPDERLLFSFLALTYNPHRIHYDRPFTVEVEGYPDLLVHGPLLAIGAVEAARRHDVRQVRRLGYRLTAPAYRSAPVTFHAEADGPDGTRVTGVQGGEVKVQARMTWRDDDEGDTHA